jgi:hypothetical protein
MTAANHYNAILGQRVEVQEGYASVRDRLRKLTKAVDSGRITPDEMAAELKSIRSQRDALDKTFDTWPGRVEAIANIEQGPADEEGNRPDDWKLEQYDEQLHERFPALSGRRAEAAVSRASAGRTDEALWRNVEYPRTD